MQLTVLCDNTVPAQPDLIGEHGFACHVATAGSQYLFDTGNGLGLLKNAKACGVDLANIDAVFLSHGHWDHCGGLIDLLKSRSGKRIKVYAHPSVFFEKISVEKGVEQKTGMGFSRLEAELAGADFVLTTEPVDLGNGLLYSGEIPQLGTDATDQSFYHRHKDCLVPDPMSDDQSLYLKSDSGLVILCGCAHAGIRNILEHALRLTGAKSIFGLVGGLHLKSASTEEVHRISHYLLQHGIQQIAASHCTGHEAISQLTNTIGAGVVLATVDSQFSF